MRNANVIPQGLPMLSMVSLHLNVLAPDRFQPWLCNHAAHRRTVSGLPVCVQLDVARHVGPEGFVIGRCHVATLMKRMGIEAIYRRPNTSKPAPGHKIYPYLLRKLAIARPNQVWAMDITYIPMARGFVYLAAVVDWFSRRVLSHRVSITMEADFCIEALDEAWQNTARRDLQHRSGKPVHQRGVHRRADRQRDRHQHGPAMSRLMLKSAKRASLIENLRSLRGLGKMRVR